MSNDFLLPSSSSQCASAPPHCPSYPDLSASQTYFYDDDYYSIPLTLLVLQSRPSVWSFRCYRGHLVHSLLLVFLHRPSPPITTNYNHTESRTICPSVMSAGRKIFHCAVDETALTTNISEIKKWTTNGSITLVVPLYSK